MFQLLRKEALIGMIHSAPLSQSTCSVWSILSFFSKKIILRILCAVFLQARLQTLPPWKLFASAFHNLIMNDIMSFPQLYNRTVFNRSVTCHCRAVACFWLWL